MRISRWNNELCSLLISKGRPFFFINSDHILLSKRLCLCDKTCFKLLDQRNFDHGIFFFMFSKVVYVHSEEYVLNQNKAQVYNFPLDLGVREKFSYNYLPTCIDSEQTFERHLPPFDIARRIKIYRKYKTAITPESNKRHHLHKLKPIMRKHCLWHRNPPSLLLSNNSTSKKS